MSMSCVEHNTVAQNEVNGTILCACHRGYYGDLCENHYDYYSNGLMATHIIETLCMVTVLIWALFRLLFIIKNKKLKINLSNGSILMNSIACILRIILLWYPSRNVLGSIETESTIYVQIILVHTAISIWMSTSLLIMGFWYDIFKKFGNEKITKKTTIIVLCISVSIFIGTIVGMSLILLVQNGNVYGLLLILLLILICIITMSIFTHKIRKVGMSVSNKNKSKVRWTVRVFISLIVAWSVYFFSNILLVLLVGAREVYIIPDMLFRLCECFIAILIMMANDYNFNSIRNIISCGKIENTISTTQEKITKTSIVTNTKTNTEPTRSRVSTM